MEIDESLVPFTCPLCGAYMNDDGCVRLICKSNHNHIISYEKELLPYKNGEKDFIWLKARMKIRLGKLIHKR
ncbi:MAG: hypothetical protein WCY09_10195 [Candidatus Omnitrophota bacterium]|jgi:hypothetical protein